MPGKAKTRAPAALAAVAIVVIVVAAWVGTSAGATHGGDRPGAEIRPGSGPVPERSVHDRRAVSARKGVGGAGSEPERSGESLVWSEEFEGPAGAPPDPAVWNHDAGGGGWGNAELQSYTDRASNAALDGQGDLVIIAREESFRGSDGVTRPYTSARLQTLGKFEFTYGTLEARIKVPEGQGLAPAFWTLGNEAYRGEHGWPGCGEIDAMEVLGSRPRTVAGHLHGPWPADPHGIGAALQSPQPLSSGFHVYAARWEAERVTFLLDGKPYETVSKAQLPSGYTWPFNHPNFILLNLAVGGEWPGAPDASTQFPARMLVDWVRLRQ